RLDHLNVKTMNKLVRYNLVRGLPTKSFDNDHTCTACLKGKQHKASCKSKSKDETSDILKKFITEIENLKDLKVKIIRCDNGGEFRNKEMNDFCSQKGIKREFSNARTPQQNGVAERRNRTLIEAARTMLADAKCKRKIEMEVFAQYELQFEVHRKLLDVLQFEVTSNNLHNAIMEAGGKDHSPMLAPDKDVPVSEGSTETTERAIERLKHDESINVQDLETDLYWEFGKFTSRDARSQQAAIRNRGKAIVNSPPPIYDQEPSMVAEDDEMSKEKEIDKLMALISLSFKKIYKPTNNNLQTPVEQIRIILQGLAEALVRECQKPKRVKDATYHKEKMLLCKQEEAGFQLNAKQAYWRDDTDDKPEDQELEAHYMYMAQIQEVNPYVADNSGPIFDTEPLQKVPNNDNYNVFAIESKPPEQSKSIHDTYLIEQNEHNVIIDSLDMSYDREQIDQNDDDDDLSNERDLLASLIKKLKCEIDDNKNRNKFLETSNKVLVNKLKGEIEDFKTKNKSLESSNNHFKEAYNELSKINELMYKDLKKFQAELDRHNDVNYASKELIAHQEIISIMSQQKEAQLKFYKTHEDKEIDKVIALENKVNVLDNIVYKTGQTVQTMNMLNRNCKTSFVKPEFLKKAQRARMYDIGCYNDNLALMLAPEYNEVIRLEKESRSKLSDLIRPFDYEKLNNLYDLFVPRREKSSAQRYFSERSKMSHTPVNNENS
nr:hypothetical protein [Tanacetum cinerariifolium]